MTQVELISADQLSFRGSNLQLKLPVQEAAVRFHEAPPNKRFTGKYDEAGNPQWSDGDLLVESLYRFKGQSAPAIVLCEVDFDALSDRDRRKLFVGITRAQMRVEVVLSEKAAGALMNAAG